MGLIGSSGSGKDDEPLSQRLLKLFSQSRDDGQLWVAIGFVLSMILGAILIGGGRNLPGYSHVEILEGAEIVDATWNPEYNGGEGLMIIEDAATGIRSLKTLDGTTDVSFDANATPLTIANSGSEGWIVGGKEGWIAECTLSSCTTMNLAWNDDSETRSNVIALASGGTGRGVAFTVPAGIQVAGQANSSGSSTSVSSGIRSFGSGTMSNASAMAMEGLNLRSIAAVSSTNGIYIGIGDDDDLVTPTADGRGGEVIVKIRNPVPAVPPSIELLHYSSAGWTHSIAVHPSSEILAVVGSTQSAYLIDHEYNLSSIPDASSSSLAVDSIGDLWLMPATAADQVGSWSVNDESVRWRQVPLTSVVIPQVGLATDGGDHVRFIGESTSGGDGILTKSSTKEIVSANVDSTASSSMVRNPDVLGDVLFLLVALISVIAIGWIVVENWGKKSW